MRLFPLHILMFASFNIAASPVVGSSIASGDVTLLSSYEVPVEESKAFEAAAISSAKTGADQHRGMWLMYEELGEKGALSSQRYFTVHFPDDIDQLTEPASDVFDLVSRLGSYRVHAELTRQVPDWCSTTSLDANKLQFAYVEYLWLKPNSLDKVSEILARRGEILRSIYGTTSDGNAAAEGFVAMVSPFQVMHVLFSAEESFEKAAWSLSADLDEHGYLEEWSLLGENLESFVVRRKSRSGRFRPALSADR